MTPGLGQADARTQVEGQARSLRGTRSQVLFTLQSSPWLKLKVSSLPGCFPHLPPGFSEPRPQPITGTRVPTSGSASKEVTQGGEITLHVTALLSVLLFLPEQ